MKRSWKEMMKKKRKKKNKININVIHFIILLFYIGEQ